MQRDCSESGRQGISFSKLGGAMRHNAIESRNLSIAVGLVHCLDGLRTSRARISGSHMVILLQTALANWVLCVNQPIVQLDRIQPSEIPVMTIPTIVTTAADASEAYRRTPLDAAWLAGNRFLAYKTSTPIAINTMASPALKDNSNISPRATRPSAMAPSRRTRADSQGTSPPLAPNATRPAQDSSAGMCEWPPGT